MASDPRTIARPQTVNQILVDRAIRHGIYVTRLAGGEAKWFNEQLPRFRRQVNEAVSPIVSQLDPGDISRTGRVLIQEASGKAEEVATGFFNQIRDEHTARLGRIASQEIDYERALFQNSIPAELEFSRPSDTFVRSLIENEPISGKTVSQWFDGLPNTTRLAINNQLEEGLLQGESINDLLRRVRGRREAGFKDGIIGRVGKQAEAIVRTGTMKASNRARQAFHQENADVIKGYQWILTLDDRTCPICVNGESQNPYPVNRVPELPAHVNCRCLSTAITKSWEELGIDLEEATPGTRASMNGEVPDSMTYPEWLEQQPESLQREILGESRFRGYKAGIPVTSFADDGRVLSLNQLASRNPSARQALGVTTSKARVYTDLPAHQRAVNEYAKTLSPDHRAALRRYTSEDEWAVDMNKAIREGRSLSPEFDRDRRLLLEIFDGAPAYRGNVYRGIGFDDTGESVFNHFVSKRKGDKIRDLAFGSSTNDRGVAENFALLMGPESRVIMNIKSKSGMDISMFSSRKIESEVLFNRGTKFKVLSRKTDKISVRRGNQIMQIPRLFLDLEEM